MTRTVLGVVAVARECATGPGTPLADPRANSEAGDTAVTRTEVESR
jgi:hypothetical protein